MQCILVRGAERRTDTFGLEGDMMSYVCESESSRHSTGQRCYCLTYQHTVTTEMRLMTVYVSVCVHSLHRSSSGIVIYHTHIHTHLVSQPSSGHSCCFMASPATMEGWQPHSARGRGKRKWEREGRRDVVSEWTAGRKKWVSVEKERGDERQTVKQGPEKRERETKKDSHTPDVLTLHTQSPVQWVQCEKLIMWFMCSACHQLFRVYLIFSTYCTYCMCNI